MIWRLMASILTLSDPGGASLATDKSDWPSWQRCQQIISDFYTPPLPQVIEGKRVVIKISASCVPVDAVEAPQEGGWSGPAYEDRQLYRWGDLPPSQRLAPY